MNSLLIIFFFIWPYTLPNNLLISEFVFLLILIKKYSTQKIKNFNCIIYLFIIFIILLSDLTSSAIGELEKKGQIFFYFKYIIIFFLMNIDLSQTAIKNIELKKVLVFSIIAILLSLVEYAYMFPKILRIGTPGVMINTNLSDAHLYSAILSLFFIQIVKLDKLNGKNLILAILLVTILLTGSRTGILTIIIFAFLRYLHLLRYVIKNIYLIAPIVMMFSYYFYDYFISNIWDLLRRGFNFNLLNDASSSIRMKKIEMAFLETADRYFFLGSGPIHAENFWYDNTFVLTMAHMGFISAIFFMVFLFLLSPLMQIFDRDIRFIIFCQYLMSDYIFTSKYQFALFVLAYVTYYYGNIYRHRDLRSKGET